MSLTLNLCASLIPSLLPSLFLLPPFTRCVMLEPEYLLQCNIRFTVSRELRKARSRTPRGPPPSVVCFIALGVWPPLDVAVLTPCLVIHSQHNIVRAACLLFSGTILHACTRCASVAGFLEQSQCLQDLVRAKDYLASTGTISDE